MLATPPRGPRRRDDAAATVRGRRDDDARTPRRRCEDAAATMAAETSDDAARGPGSDARRDERRHGSQRVRLGETTWHWMLLVASARRRRPLGARRRKKDEGLPRGPGDASAPRSSDRRRRRRRWPRRARRRLRRSTTRPRRTPSRPRRRPAFRGRRPIPRRRRARPTRRRILGASRSRSPRRRRRLERRRTAGRSSDRANGPSRSFYIRPNRSRTFLEKTPGRRRSSSDEVPSPDAGATRPEAATVRPLPLEWRRWLPIGEAARLRSRGARRRLQDPAAPWSSA